MNSKPLPLLRHIRGTPLVRDCARADSSKAERRRPSCSSCVALLSRSANSFLGELTLDSIGAGQLPQVLVFNKCDALPDHQQPRHARDLYELPDGRRCERVFVSALSGEGLPELRSWLAAEVARLPRLRAPAALALATARVEAALAVLTGRPPAAPLRPANGSSPSPAIAKNWPCWP